MYMTIPQFFAHTLTCFRDRIAIRNTKEKPQEPQEVTYRELGHMADKLAVGLEKMEIVKGDRVAIMSRPRIRFAAAFLAIARLGGWVIPVDPTLTVSEVADIINRSGTKAIFAPEELFERLPQDGIERINFDDGNQGTTFLSLLIDGTPPQVKIDESDIAPFSPTHRAQQVKQRGFFLATETSPPISKGASR